jgi:hypothetical protein
MTSIVRKRAAANDDTPNIQTVAKWLMAIVTLAGALCLGGPTLAQNLVEPSTSSLPIGKAPSISERHVAENGKPCITVDEFHPKSQIDTDFYEHWIRATNRCGQYIKLRVCRHGSDECIAMSVPPWDSKNGFLGLSPMAAELQYEIRERF